MKGVFIIASFCLGEGVFSQSTNLFDSEQVIELTLSSDLKAVFRDRGDDPEYHPASLHYESENQVIHLPVKIKTRGHFRKLSENCNYPPFKLNFSKSTILVNTLFEGQNKLKLVTPCRSDKLVIHEYLVYKLYNLLTPKSFKVRLVKVIFHDSHEDENSDSYYAILIEDETQMASRNQAISIEEIGLRPENTRRPDFLRMALFQYMIGNTDWSVQYQQNIKLLAADSIGIKSVVPYDFDHAGIVRAAYAKPAAALKMKSKFERRYRGFCISQMFEYSEIFEIFRQKKNEIYSLYEDNFLLSEKYKKQTIKFLDQFYKTINNPKKAKRAFTYPCKTTGTENVVIKGMKY
ncbi:MAG: hypothetical protein ACI9FN_000716 [Saprospiraceae bacterium]|jgi:hypothetical protein